MMLETERNVWSAERSQLDPLPPAADMGCGPMRTGGEAAGPRPAQDSPGLSHQPPLNDRAPRFYELIKILTLDEKGKKKDILN